MKRKICVVLVDRANYGRLKPVMSAIHEHDDLELQVVCAGTMVLERFSRPADGVRADGFPVDGEIHIELEGSTPTTMAKSVGFGVIEFTSEFQRLKPDFVLIIGDRYEALGAAIGAAYMNLPIVHLQGGEVSGSIDESARHAISKFAQFHVPSTRRSAEYLVRMGEKPDTIMTIGCPSSDIAKHLDRSLDPKILNDRGSGIEIDVEEPFALVIFHPTTTQFGNEAEEMLEVLKALDELDVQTALLWPNIDAGSDHISKVIRIFKDQSGINCLRTLTNLPPEKYHRVLANASLAIGNSSSFVRDAGFFGTPVVLVGNRQDGREADEHLIRVTADKTEILEAAKHHLEHGRYEPSTLYGDGNVCKRIAEGLTQISPYIQKRLHYVYEDSTIEDVEAAKGMPVHNSASLPMD